MKEYKLSEVAELLKVDRTTVWRWVKQGRFRNVRRSGFGETSPNKIGRDSVLEVAEQLGIEIEEAENGQG